MTSNSNLEQPRSERLLRDVEGEAQQVRPTSRRGSAQPHDTGSALCATRPAAGAWRASGATEGRSCLPCSPLNTLTVRFIFYGGGRDHSECIVKSHWELKQNNFTLEFITNLEMLSVGFQSSV